VYNNGSTVSTTITAATGGNFEKLVPDNTNPPTTVISDSIDTTTVTLSTNDTAITEGGQITYTATLSNEAHAPVTVTLSNGQVITIDAGKTTGTVVFQTPVNDVYNNGSTVSTTITAATGGNFEKLVPDNTNPPTTVISDSIDTTTVTLSTTDTAITEGGQITYTATLSNEAHAPVTVTLSNGQVITIDAGKTTGTVVFQTPVNDVYNNGSTVSTTITTATGGNFEKLVPDNTNPPTTTITDSIDTTTVTLSTNDTAITEGGQITYTATLSNEAHAPVTVTLSNGQVITIDAGKTTGTVVFQTPVNDVYNNGSTVSTTITTATGGNFEKLVPDNTNPPTTVISDSIDTTTVTLSTNDTVITEGSQITYTATLSNEAHAPVTVTLSNGQVITIDAGKTTGTVVFQTPVNDVYNNGSTVSTTISTATGGNFEKLVPDNTNPPTTVISDSIDTTTVTLSTTDTAITEGGQITYTATLSNEAHAPVTVTLSNGQVITIDAGKTTGTVVFQTPVNDVYNNGSTVSTTITTATGGNFEKLVPDNTNPPTTVISDSIDTTTVTLSTNDTAITEGGQITYTATLSNEAHAPVTVTLSNGQVIAIDAGKTTGTVVFQTPANDVYNNGSTVSTTISTATGGNFEKLVPDNSHPAVTTITDSIDTTTVKLSTTDTAITEGGQITYTATLSNEAHAPVTVTLSNGQVITIDTGKTTGTVVFQTPANDVYNNGSTVSTTITTATGGNFEKLVPDNSHPAVTTITDSIDTTTVTLSTNDTAITEGGQITYTATLTNVAHAPVTVTLSNGQVITIDSGKTTGTVVFQTPANDVYNNGSTVSTTITTATGGNFEKLVPDNSHPAVTTITDSIDTTTVKLSTTDTAITEGGQITYTATLSNEAHAPVTVTLSNGQVITIDAGKTTGTVVFQTPANDVYNNGSTVSTTISTATGGNFEKLVPDNSHPAVTTITDSIDTTTVKLSTTDTAITEGGQITYTATLSNEAHAPVTVTLSNGQVITIDSGKTTGTVVFQTPANDVYNNGSTVSTTITTATGGNFEKLVPDNSHPAVTTITDSIDTTTVKLSTTDTAITEGGQITYTATLSNEAHAPVTVTLSNGQVITIDSGKTTGTVVFQTPANDVYNNGSTVSTTITTATGGNFEKLVPDNSHPAVTTITDSIDTTTVKLSTTDTAITEGGQITYTATLSNVAHAPVTVTLSNGQVITIDSGKTTGTVVFQTPANDVYNNGSTVSTTITTATGGNFEKLVPDNTNPPTTVISDSIDTTTVTLSTANTAITEGGQITYTATLSNVAHAPVTVTLSNGQVITIDSGKTTGTVVFQTPANDVYNNGSTVSTTITTATGGNFEKLVPDNSHPAVTTITDSIDTTTVKLSTTDTAITEGGQITYTATLSNVAHAPVTVTLSNGQVITIDSGKTTGTVVFQTPANDVYNNGSTVSTTITTATGGNFEKLVPDNTNPPTTTITDSIDTTTVALSTANTAITEGGQITYTATLSNVAHAPVTVTLSNGQVITIDSGKTTGTVVFQTPPNDVYNNGSTVSTTITTATGGNFEKLVPDNSHPAVTTITDSIDTTTISITGDASVNEGQTAHYTLTLSNPAATDVTVTLKYSGTATDGSDFNGVYTVKIPAGASSATFNVNTLDDKLTEPTETLVITIDKTSGGNFEKLAISGTNGSISTNIIDNDAPPVIDLDANNSSGATGADYKVTFTEGTTGPGVSIADTDIKITDPDSTMLTGATVTLTNAQVGDALNLGNSVNGITINSNNQTGTITLTLSGTATLADYMTRIQNITFTNNSHDPSTTPRIITVTVTDGGNYSNVATATVNVVAVNDAPVATGSAVTGTEDTPLALAWSNFGVTDVDSPQASLGVKITELPVAGKLQFLAADGVTWSNVTSGQTFTKAQIDAGQLRFTPNANESGTDGYGGTGIGNKQADYAQFKFQPTDGKDLGTAATVKVDITPVADAPNLTVADNTVNSVGLTKQSWNSIANLGTSGNGAAPADLKNAIDNAGTPNTSTTVTTVVSEANVAGGSGSKTSGLIYMEAGKTYTFSGTGDDSLVVNVGGKDVASALWGTNSGKFSGSITPTVSGYYSIEIYHANQSGPGSYNVNVQIGNGAVQPLNTSGIPLYTGVSDLINAGVTLSDLHGSNGDGYYTGYKLNEGLENGSVHLSKVTTSLTDTDGSESLSVKISGIPAGSVLTDGAGHTYSAGASTGEVNVTGWDLSTLTIKPPTYYSGQFNLTVTSTSTESLGGSAVTTAQLPVTIYPANYNSITATSGSDNITGTDGNDIVVADIGGLNVVQGKNYNIAFMVDSSGSMSTDSVNAAKASLTSVFSSLKNSLGANTSGTVNIFVADFDTQVNKSVAINLNDPNALAILKGVLDSMVSGGGTNYEDVFKATANFFQSSLATGNTGATNLTYFITDGQPTYFQNGEQTNPVVTDFYNYNTTDGRLDDYINTNNYQLGNAFSITVGSSKLQLIDSAGQVHKWMQNWNGSWYDSGVIGTVHAQGDGTYEVSYLDGSGSSTSSATTSNAGSGFALLSGLSSVEAIGINSGVSLNDLKPYDSDGKPQSNIDPKDLANAILGHTEATLPGSDTINGGDGNDIIFGDLVSFSGITGEGYNALQAFVAQKTGMAVTAVTTSNVHQYVTEHYADFDVSGAKDGNDTLLGGAGDDILFGQGGNDYLDGGKGNDILLGGTGNDTLIGGPGNDILVGGAGADLFVWKAGDLGNDVIKDFKAADGDRIDLRDLLKGESDSTIDNYLKITTVEGVSTLQVSTEGNLNKAGGLANADVTIKLEGNDWSHTSINSLISGADPTIKIDHTA
ncbi:immunoglobulin-like domain-containing protein, partial [Pseudomonas yamanorum]|uniref:immunoglobulin-like domain-containing protein n=1 Tax=Pseudomonas yamanorum TaxID=515393 RepID=UPI002108F797